MVMSTKRNPLHEALKKKSNTIKNKRKYKSRTRRIKRSKNLKGGSVIDILKKTYSCYMNPFGQCVTTSFDSLEKISGLSSSINVLSSYVEIAKQLLEFYLRINIDSLNSPHYSELDKLKSTFKDTMKELKETISFLETNNIIHQLDRPNKKLLHFITVIIVQEISNLSLSGVNTVGKIAIWANWYRSKLENLISQLTAILTQLNSIYIEFPLKTSPAPAAPTPDNTMQAPASAMPAPVSATQAPVSANSMTTIKNKDD